MTTQLTNSINTDFLQEWQPFDKMYNKVKSAMLRHFLNNIYTWQPTHEENSKIPFKPYTFTTIDMLLGLAYTSSSCYAGLWVCNAGYLWADDTHYFTGFAINTDNKVIGIAHDFSENEIFITL